VAARPRVAVLATGDELLPVAHALRPASIRDSNSPTLVAQCARAGAEGVRAGPAPDDEAALRAAVEEALSSCDLLCVTGGVSVGDRDLVPAVLAACGVERLFHRWDAKPGGPLWAGRRGETLVFGLPGNPGASFVAFEVAVVPVLRTRMGLPFAPRATVPAATAGRFPAPGPRRLFVPVDLGFPCDGPPLLVASPVPSRGSGDPFAWGRAAGLAVVRESGEPGPRGSSASPGPGAASAGALPCVEVIPLGTLLGRCSS
jgi:molybdopterin molybdotransferase